MIKYLSSILLMIFAVAQIFSQSYSDAKSLYKKGNFEDAEMICDEIISSNPDQGTEAQTLLLLGQIKLKTKDYKSAITNLSSAKTKLKELGSDEGEAVSAIYLGDADSKNKSYC